MDQPTSAKRQFSLKQRATLTVLSSMLLQAAEFLTGLFISPYIIRSLGKELFGAWGLIQQAPANFSMTDFRGPITLRFLLGMKQHEKDPGSNQRLIGATLVLWCFCIPFTILLGTGLVYFAPIVHWSGRLDLSLRQFNHFFVFCIPSKSPGI